MKYIIALSFLTLVGCAKSTAPKPTLYCEAPGGVMSIDTEIPTIKLTETRDRFIVQDETSTISFPKSGCILRTVN